MTRTYAGRLSALPQHDRSCQIHGMGRDRAAAHLRLPRPKIRGPSAACLRIPRALTRGCICSSSASQFLLCRQPPRRFGMRARVSRTSRLAANETRRSRDRHPLRLNLREESHQIPNETTVRLAFRPPRAEHPAAPLRPADVRIAALELHAPERRAVPRRPARPLRSAAKIRDQDPIHHKDAPRPHAPGRRTNRSRQKKSPEKEQRPP